MNKMMKELKNMSREEREEFFKSHKSELMDLSLENVSGGVTRCRENPNSDIISFKGNWISSDGFVCNGEVIC